MVKGGDKVEPSQIIDLITSIINLAVAILAYKALTKK